MDMNLILASIGVFLVVILLLVIILLVAKYYLVPSGKVKISINGGDKVLEVNSGSTLLNTLVTNDVHLMSSVFIEVCRGIYNHWTNECKPKHTDLYIELASRWEMTNSLIDWNCSVNDEKGLLYSAAEHKDKVEVLSMEVNVRDDVEISEVELAAGLFWEMTFLEPKKIVKLV